MSVDPLHELMLDALRRGILMTRGANKAPADGATRHASRSKSRAHLDEKKKQMCRDINTLTRDQKIQVLLAIAQLAGFEAIGAHNGGCLVDITDWDMARVTKIINIMQYVTQ